MATRIQLPTKETIPAQSKPILDRYEKNLGMVPNFFTLLSLSPDTLKAVAEMHATLGKSLGHKTRERIHIAIAEVNGCDYCLSTHTWVGGKYTGLTKEDMELNRDGHSTDPKADAAVQFAHEVAKSRGHVHAADIESVRAAGYTDAQIIDIVAELAFSFVTNLFNTTFETEIDPTTPVMRTRHSKAEGKTPNAGVVHEGPSVSIPAEQITFVGSGVKTEQGELMAGPAYGNLQNGRHGTFVRLPAGFISPVHTHTEDYYAVVLEGVASNHAPDAEAVPLPVGSYWFQRGEEPHVTQNLSDKPALLFIVQPGKFDYLMANA